MFPAPGRALILKREHSETVTCSLPRLAGERELELVPFTSWPQQQFLAVTLRAKGGGRRARAVKHTNGQGQSLVPNPRLGNNCKFSACVKKSPRKSSGS